jgi:hypothetical protein
VTPTANRLTFVFIIALWSALAPDAMASEGTSGGTSAPKDEATRKITPRTGTLISRPFAFRTDAPRNDTHMGIRLLGTLELRTRRVNGISLVELSGLAWDADESVLYAISDNGAVFHLTPQFVAGRLATVYAQEAHRLHAPDGSVLTGAESDAEGLAVRNASDGVKGNSQLVVSFERHPRVDIMSPKGVSLGRIATASAFNDIRHFRSSNKALESVALLPRHGWLAAPEWPLKSHETIAIANAQNTTLHYPRFPARKCALVAMQPIKGQSLLTLERCFDRATATLIVALRRVDDANDANDGDLLAPKTIAVFDSRGEFAVDNFEGLAHHEGQRYFMVSDDNANFLQRTLLVYFELLEP